jgi:hypothetical protein
VDVGLKFLPSFPDICDFFCLIIDTMILSVTKLPCIDTLLFQNTEDIEKFIRTVKVEEELVDIAKERIRKMVTANSYGPEK